MRWVRYATCVIALSCVAAMCCAAARVRVAGEKTAGPSTSPSTHFVRSGSPLRMTNRLRGRRAAKKAVALTPWEQAERGREALEAIPAETRTRADYTRAMDAYRAIYHAGPADIHAPAAVNAVAELLAEQGRVLHDEKSLRAAVGQYEFLRTQYPEKSAGCAGAAGRGSDCAERPEGCGDGARAVQAAAEGAHPKSEQAEEARAGIASFGPANWEQETGRVVVRCSFSGWCRKDATQACRGSHPSRYGCDEWDTHCGGRVRRCRPWRKLRERGRMVQRSNAWVRPDPLIQQ